MDVQCEKCGTEYALDETLVGPSGTAVRCTSCGHVFKVYPRAEASPARETWMLRQASGATFPFDRLGVLQDWISEGKVSQDDLIAKSGGEWKRLGDIAEMRPFFDASRTAKPSMPAPSAPAAGYPGTPPSEHAATIRAPAGSAPPQAPSGAPGPQGPSTAEYGLPPADEFAATQKIQPTPGQAGPQTIGHAPTVQAQAPTIQAQAQTVPAYGQQSPGQTPTLDPTAPTQQQIHSPLQSPPDGTHQQEAMKPTRPLRPSSQDPGPATDSPYGPSQVDNARTVALSESDPRYAKAVSQPPKAAAAPGTVISEPAFSESQIPTDTDGGHWEQGAGVQAEGPAWAEHGAGLPDDDFADERPEPSRKIGRWIALVIVVLIVGGGFYMFMFQREMVKDLLAGVIGGEDGGRHETFFVKGRENYLLDTFPAFRQADREYQKVLALSENDAKTLAALAEMYAVWAQHLRDASLDARADALTAAAGGAAPDLREAERYEADVQEKIAEARRWGDQALSADPELPAVRLALAEVKRLSGDLDAARNEVERAGKTDTGATLDYVAALIAIDEGREAEGAAADLEKIVKKEALLRALYLQARALAAAGDPAGAKQALARLTELNSQHSRARELADRIAAASPVFLTRKALDDHFATAQAGAPDAGVEPDTDTGPAETAPPTKVAPVGGGGGGGGEFVPTGGSPDAMLAKAAKLQQSGNTSAAAGLFKKVLEVQPSNIDALCGLAYCYLDGGSKGQAISHFRRALNVNGSYGPALIGLANTYKSQGQKEQALKWYKKYLQVRPGGRHASLAKANIEKLEAELAKKPTGGEPEGDSIFGAPPPGQETPKDKPPAGSDDKPKDPPADQPPATDKPAGGSTNPYGPPADDPKTKPQPKEQPPATEG
jgi:predicted Zn finger-like uncharacterized protein